jgi:antitoxin (DNA-binding transcriptional repressor) of toxin-antitoxin stability system
MRTDSLVAAAELRRHLRDHLDGVLQGRTFQIERNGRVVAVLGPPTEEVHPDDEE